MSDRDADPVATHRAHAPKQLACHVVTISDTRSARDDRSGGLIRRTLEEAGHRVTGPEIVQDAPQELRDRLVKAVAGGAQVVVTTGGTGLSPRDCTYEVVSQLVERPLPGFGELFRALSYEEVGSAAMLSRATAGTLQSSVVFALPGSPKAVTLALEKLIVPEVGHVLEQLSR